MEGHESCECFDAYSAHMSGGKCLREGCGCPKFKLASARTVDADFIPNEQPDDPSLSITPPMTAKEFRKHCKTIAENKEKPMVTRLVAFGLGAFVEGVTDGISEVLGDKKSKRKKLKR